MKPSLDELLDFLAETGRKEILKSYRKDSCIASTRIGVEFLRAFGYSARPVPVKQTILNGPMKETIDRKLDEPLEGSYILAIEGTDHMGEDGGWDGHLIFTIEDNLVDLSLDQATRPHKGIFLEPLVGKLHDEWPKEPVGFQLGEIFVGYQLLEGQNFRKAGDWNRRQRWSPIVGKLIRDWRVKCSP